MTEYDPADNSVKSYEVAIDAMRERFEQVVKRKDGNEYSFLAIKRVSRRRRK